MAQTQIKKTLDVAPERPEKNESMIQGKGRKDSSQLTRNYGRIAAAVSPQDLCSEDLCSENLLSGHSCSIHACSGLHERVITTLE